MEKCIKCDKDTMGYKCDVCGAESNQNDTSHECGLEHCMPKCVGCNEAQAKCPC